MTNNTTISAELLNDEYVHLADHRKIIEALAADNAGLRDVENYLSRSDVGYAAQAIAEGNGADANESLRAGMRAIIDDIPVPATDAVISDIEARARAELLSHIEAEIAAIDTVYRGDPSYEHDAHWIKSAVLDLLSKLRNTEARSNGE